MGREIRMTITPRGCRWVTVTYVRMPWERWAIRLRWAVRNALTAMTPAVASMVEMQKHIG